MSRNLRALWDLMRGSRLRYGLAIATLVMASCFLYLAPLIPQAVIDGVLLDGGDAASPIVSRVVGTLGGATYVADHLWLPVLVMAGLTAVAGLFTYARERLSATATESIVRRLRDRLYDHLQRLPCRYHDEAESGDLVQRCTSDVDTVRVFLADHVVELGRMVIMFFVPIPLMLAIDTRMTLASVVLAPFILGFSLFFFGKVRRSFKASDEAEGKLTATVQENLAGIRVVRAFAQQAHENERFGGRNRNYQEREFGVYWVAAWFWATSDFICFVQQGVVVGVGLYLMGTAQLTVGSFFFFLTVVGMFIYPMRQLGRLVSDFGKATVALGRIREILESEAEPQPQVPGEIEKDVGRVELQGVTFGYDPARPVLQDLSLTVEPKSTLAIVGASGSGKTTIISLLMRLYDVDAGRIVLDGVDVRELNTDDLRRRLSIVQQEPFLFSKTIVENLRLGRADATFEEIEHATRTACVHEAIARFDDGYDTKVGERGVTLSGGQRQRVAIARALLQRPSVLVLDDALSAVDTGTESLILSALSQRRGRHTTLVIAHRLSTIALADRVIVLDRGRIVQDGTPDELKTTPGPFARIWARQTQVAAVAVDREAG